MRPLIVSVLVAALPLLSSPAAKADLPVDLELVLAVDVSGSVDEEEAKLQRAGYIDALLNPKVIGAIRSGPLGRIAVAYMEWAGDHYQRVTVGWTLLDGPAAAQARASRAVFSAMPPQPSAGAVWVATRQTRGSGRPSGIIHLDGANCCGEGQG